MPGRNSFDTSGGEISPTWWLFYWCNRYCLSATPGGGAQLVERFRFLPGNMRKVLEL